MTTITVSSVDLERIEISKGIADEVKETAPMETFEEEESSAWVPRSKGTLETFDQEDTDQPSDEEKEMMEEKELNVQEVGDEDEEALLTEDSYSLLYTSEYCSRTALFAWFSIGLQGGLLLVTFLDLFNTSPEGNETNGSSNRMEIPAGATWEVMIAQFLGMLLTAMVMAADGDLVKGVTQLIKGYDPKIQVQSPHASRFRWLMTGLLQSFFGLILLFDSFVLSMQSATVIDLSLNLTALHFIQEVDEMAFNLAADSGLFGPKVTEDCEHVRNLKGYSSPASRGRKLNLRRGLILLMTIGLLIPYFLVITQQSNGDHVCDNVYIQFGDEYIPKMAHYSGPFRSQGNQVTDRHNQRNYYVDETNAYKLAYCDTDNFWTISERESRACHFLFRSAETETFDVIEAADLDWFVDTADTGVIDVDWLKIICNDCNTEETCLEKNGVCKDGKCECHEARFGINCQFEEKCTNFALDQRTRDGLATIPGTNSFLEKEYVSLRWDDIPEATPMFYDRPIYVPVSETNVSLQADNIDSFIIFTGRRWALYAIPDEDLALVVAETGIPANWSNKEFNNYFYELNVSSPTHFDALQNLTGYLNNYFPIFFSSPLNYGETIFGFDPSQTTWLLATTPYDDSNPIIPAFPDDGQPVSARFLCTDCVGQEKNCLNGGRCSADINMCVCPAYYKGFQCERLMDCVGADGCSGEGKCNKETRTCNCNEGSYGSLCQFGKGASAVQDLFLCNECRWASMGRGSCNNTFAQECSCKKGYGGKYCNETAG